MIIQGNIQLTRDIYHGIERLRGSLHKLYGDWLRAWLALVHKLVKWDGSYGLVTPPGKVHGLPDGDAFKTVDAECDGLDKDR